MNSPLTRAAALEARSKRDRDLLDLWPHDCYRFGDELAAAAKALIVETSPLREDRSFVLGVMRLILDRARAQGVQFNPAVDVVILDSGAAHVTDHLDGWGRYWRTSPTDPWPEPTRP